MHAVFMGMPTASSEGGVPLTGMQPLTTMARQTLEAQGCQKSFDKCTRFFSKNVPDLNKKVPNL